MKSVVNAPQRAATLKDLFVQAAQIAGKLPAVEHQTHQQLSDVSLSHDLKSAPFPKNSL
jgi:hypothetical protein